jgi:hypothetical protein
MWIASTAVALNDNPPLSTSKGTQFKVLEMTALCSMVDMHGLSME